MSGVVVNRCTTKEKLSASLATSLISPSSRSSYGHQDSVGTSSPALDDDHHFVSSMKETLLPISKQQQQQKYEEPKTPEMTFIGSKKESNNNNNGHSSNTIGHGNGPRSPSSLLFSQNATANSDGWTANHNNIINNGDDGKKKGQDERPSRRSIEPMCDVVGESRKRSREGSMSLPSSSSSMTMPLTKDIQHHSFAENVSDFVVKTQNKRDDEVSKKVAVIRQANRSGLARSIAVDRTVTAKGKKRSVNKSSVYRGVSKCGKDGRWQTRIRVGNAVKYLGRFATEEIAARCYDAAFVTFFGTEVANQVGMNFADSVFLFDPDATHSEIQQYENESSVTFEALQTARDIVSKIGSNHHGSVSISAKQLQRYKRSSSPNYDEEEEVDDDDENKNDEDDDIMDDEEEVYARQRQSSKRRRMEKALKMNEETKEKISSSIFNNSNKTTGAKQNKIKVEKSTINPFLASLDNSDDFGYESDQSRLNTVISDENIGDFVEQYHHLGVQSRDILGAYHLLSLSSSCV